MSELKNLLTRVADKDELHLLQQKRITELEEKVKNLNAQIISEECACCGYVIDGQAVCANHFNISQTENEELKTTIKKMREGFDHTQDRLLVLEGMIGDEKLSKLQISGMFLAIKSILDEIEGEI